MPLYSPDGRYRLVLADDSFGCAETIEFEAPSAEAALHRARHQCFGREAELFEDGRSLGRLRCMKEDGGYWTLSAEPTASGRTRHMDRV